MAVLGVQKRGARGAFWRAILGTFRKLIFKYFFGAAGPIFQKSRSLLYRISYIKEKKTIFKTESYSCSRVKPH